MLAGASQNLNSHHGWSVWIHTPKKIRVRPPD
jgi:hypothetical protein